MYSSFLRRGNSWVLFKKCKTKSLIKKKLVSPSIKYTQFPLSITWPSTVRKSQGLSLEQSVWLAKTKIFWDMANTYRT